MRFLRRAWEDIRRGEDLDLYVTVVVAIILAMLNALGKDLSLSAPVSLAILALLAVAILGNRHRLETIINMITSAYDILHTDFPDHVQQEIVEKIEQSADLLLIGIDLDGTLTRHYSLLEKKLREGDKVRAILVDPDGSACGMVVKRRYRPTTVDSQCAQIRSGIEALQELSEKTAGDLQIRVIDYPLTRGGIVVDVDAPNGVLYIWNYSFKTHRENRPKYILRPADGYWYEFFKEEANAIWNDAVPYQRGTSK